MMMLLADRPPGARYGRPLEYDPTGIWLIPDGYPWMDGPPDAN